LKFGIRARFFLISLGLIVLCVAFGAAWMHAALRHGPSLALLELAVLPALVVAVVMSSLAARLVSRTARSLTETARRMVEGDLSARAHFAGADEFGELSRALDQLSRNLSGSLGELMSERDRLGGILSGMQEGVLLLDDEERVELINPALREMLLLGTDAAGKTALELIRHAELKELLDEARRASAHVTREIELSGLKPRRLLVRAAPLSGERDGLFAVFVDVTEMRRLESLRRDFVANVSHELRTPVTAIRSAAETLHVAAHNDPEAVARFVDIIERNAERLHDLVEDLLDLSRIESREFRVRFEPVELEPVFAHVLSLFRERAEKKNIRLAFDTEPGVSSVRADRRALENVLTNLVDNAVKYCGNGAEVRLLAAADDDRVRVSVRDTGPGIEARHLPRVFERFYRVDSGRSRELGGTGLGLSIVKHLVEAMRGEVGVESAPGRGTEFHFTLERVGESSLRAVARASPSEPRERTIN
jgi:two-component system, OmpR family, phosphate regulon sensor histidine kinase PhoR